MTNDVTKTFNRGRRLNAAALGREAPGFSPGRFTDNASLWHQFFRIIGSEDIVMEISSRMMQGKPFLSVRMDRFGLYLMEMVPIRVDIQGYEVEPGDDGFTEAQPCHSLGRYIIYQWPAWMMRLLGVREAHHVATNSLGIRLRAS